VAVLVVAWSTLRGFDEGTSLGVIGGLLLDITSGAPFGLHTVVLGLMGAVASMVDGQTVRANVALLFSVGVLLTVAYHLAIMLGLQALGWQAPPIGRFLRILFPAAMANAILLPLAYLVSERLYRALTGWRQMEV
jgi:rod shape-determining protein MreD